MLLFVPVDVMYFNKWFFFVFFFFEVAGIESYLKYVTSTGMINKYEE